MTKDYLLMALVTLFWSGSFIAGKFALREMGPMEVAFLRFVLSVICFYPLLKVKRAKLRFPLSLKTHLELILIGALTTFAYHFLFFAALKHTSAISASLIIAFNPIMTMLISAIVFSDERMTSRKGAGALISFFGVLLVITHGQWWRFFEISWNRGDILMLLAVVCWSSSLVFSRKMLKRVDTISVTFYSIFYGLFFYIPFLGMSGFFGHFPQASGLTWGSILYMALFSTVIGYLVYYEAIRNIGPSQTALMLNLIPVFTAILAILLLGEELILSKVIGALMVFSGITLVTLGKRKKKEIPYKISDEF